MRTTPSPGPASGLFRWLGSHPVKPQSAAPKAQPKPAPEVQGKGFGAFLQRQIDKFKSTRPDHSVDGFLAAIKLAIDYAGKRDWNTAEDMCEEIEQQMCDALRVPGGVSVEYVARNRETKQPRLLILTEWGFREAVEGQLSFNLHFKPERPGVRSVK